MQPPAEPPAVSGPVGITFVLPNLVRGGTERQVLTLARLLDPARFRLSLLTAAGGGPLLEQFRSLMPVHVYGDQSQAVRFGGSPLGHLRTVGFLAGKLRQEKPDIMHAWLPLANLLGAAAARLARIPRVVVSKRGLTHYKKHYPRLARLEPLGNRLADVVLVNSDAVRRDVERTERCRGEKFRKVYNGVGAIAPWSAAERSAWRRREGIPAGVPVVLAVSNFYPYKGHADLVEAFAAAAEKVPGALLLLAGRDAGTEEKVRVLAAETGHGGAVRFLGERTDVADLLRAADLFVHPSREEGFCNAILEAMSAGRAVVACRTGGNGEAVIDGVTGLLVPPGNPARFAEAMTALLADPGRMKAMGEEGRRRAGSEFSLGAMREGMESLYDSLTGRGGGEGRKG